MAIREALNYWIIPLNFFKNLNVNKASKSCPILIIPEPIPLNLRVSELLWL